MCGPILPPCGCEASLLSLVAFEVIQIYCGDSKNWTSALLRGALSLLRRGLTEIMKVAAKSCLISARSGNTEALVFPPPRSDFKRWLITLRWIIYLMSHIAHTDRKTCFRICEDCLFQNITQLLKMKLSTSQAKTRPQKAWPRSTWFYR